LVQIDILTLTHYKSNEDLGVDVAYQKARIFGYFYFVIFVGTIMLLFYAINLGVARLFAYSPFSVFSNLEFVMIYVFVRFE